jgi:hypothetical protein
MFLQWASLLGVLELTAPSVWFLELLAACGGMPELVTLSIGLLELLAPCSGMPELFASKEVALMDKFLIADMSLPP